MRSVWWLVLAAVVAACGSRTALKDSPYQVELVDGGPDVPVVVDVPGRPDVPIQPDIPTVPDIPIVRDVPVIRDIPIGRDVPSERVIANCPSSRRLVETQSATLAASATSATGRPLTYQWAVESGPAPIAFAPPNAPTTTVTFATPGTFRLRFTATNDVGQSDSCVTAVAVDPAINLLCPNDQSRFVSETAPLIGRAESRLGRPLVFAWEMLARPAGARGTVTPSMGTTPIASLPLDQVGDWRVRLTARDSGGLTTSCITQVRVDPDVLAQCPDNLTSRPFSTVQIAGRGLSRLGRPLTYQWTTEIAPPTSTASLLNANQPTASYTFDVAGDWTWRLTVRNDRGNFASCTTRALAASTEAIRVELVWNMDRSCRSCNAQGGGIDIDLHLTDLSRSNGRWASNAPGQSDCYYANCRCSAGVGTLCPSGAIEWPPESALNNPQLDVDHISDLPGPENINVLQAAPGSRFAVGVHYFSGSETTPTVVRVYCGGVVVFESEPVRLSPGGGENPLWRVGDIEVGADGRACVFRRCGTAGNTTACIRGQSAW